MAHLAQRQTARPRDARRWGPSYSRHFRHTNCYMSSHDVWLLARLTSTCLSAPYLYTQKKMVLRYIKLRVKMRLSRVVCVCVWFRHGHEWWWYEGNTHTLFLSLSLSLSFLPFSSLSHSPSLVPPLFLHLSPFVSLPHTHTRTHTYSPFSKGRRIVRVMSEVWGCEIVDTSATKTLVLDIWNIVYISKTHQIKMSEVSTCWNMCT